MKKVLAIMLACFMLVSLLPMGALAEEIEQVKCPYEGKNHYKTNCEYTWVADVKGECGEYDYTVYSCNACGDYFAADFVKIDGEHDFVVTKAATCTEAGEQVCAICEAKEEIPALGHKASGEASCLEASVCTVCGEELDAKTAHTWGEKPSAIVKEPNEETLENGLAEYTCTVCGEVKEVVILAHQCENFTFVYGGIAPSCTEPGMESYFQCNDEKCQRYWTMAIVDGQIIPGEIVDKSELEIPAIGKHGEPEEMMVEFAIAGDGYYTPGELPAGLVGTIEFTYESYNSWNYIRIQRYDPENDWWDTIEWVYADGEAYPVEFVEGEQYRLMWMSKGTLKFEFVGMEQIIPGSCTEDGTRIWQCSVCHEKVEENLGKQHNWAVTYHTEPTCTTYGYTIESCLDCGENSITRHDKLGHTERPEDCYGYGTCTEFTYYWYCDRCGVELEETIETTCPTETITVEATCNGYGYTFTYCTRGSWCADWNWETNPLVDTITGKLPNGEEVTIKLDGEYMIKSFEITSDKDASKHNEADKAKGNVIEPTCEEEGLIAYWCTDCETPIREPIAKLGHDYNEELVTVEPTCAENGYIGEICDRCGKLHIIEVIEFTTDYIYMNYESAANCHNLEGAVCEIFREGVCGELAQLDRYLCATCNEYILVKNDSFENHIMPEDLVSREEAVQPEDIEVEEVYTGKGDCYFYHEFPADVTVTFVSDIELALYFEGSYITRLAAGEAYTMDVTAGEHEINPYKYGAEFNLTMTYTIEAEMEFAGVDATCTEDGYTAQYYCERCGKFVASEEIKAAGHKEVIDVEAKEATCTEAGATKGWHCEVCDYAEESKNIPAKGHTVILVDSAEWEENKQYGYEHYQCTTCGYEYIINYEPVCIHEWNTRADRDLSIAATCTAEGKKVYKCLHCDAVKEEIIDRLHHTNAAGQDLEYCGTETEDCICASCKEEFEIPAHDYDDGVFYPANCLSNAYIMYTCQVCDHYEVEDITETKGEHVWGRWAPVYDENGVVVEEARGCAACGIVERREVTEIAFSATIENAANAEGTITDGSLVKVTIAVSGSEDNAWGFQLNIPYAENMTYVEAKFVTTSFTYATIATNHDGFVTIIANADGDVILNGKENIVELYFTVAAPEKSEIAVDIEIVETLNAEGKPVEAVAFGAKAETVLLMELDGEEGITLADALVAYNLIVANEYDAAADLDKDGTVTLADYLYLFNFLSGAMDYEEIVALG